MKKICSLGPLLCLFLFVSCSSPEKGYFREPKTLEAKGEYVHVASGMKFPERISGFERVMLTQYDAEATDVSVGYNFIELTKPIFVTLYVYPAPQVMNLGSPKGVVLEARQELCRREVEARKKATLQNRPGRKFISERSIEMIQLKKKQKGRQLIFEFQPTPTAPVAMQSQLIFFCDTDRDWIVKYQVSYPLGKDFHAEIDRFMKELKWH
jgi:hypothetical protein